MERKCDKACKVVKSLIKEYLATGQYKTNWDINNGGCEDFTMDAIKRLGGYDEATELVTDNFAEDSILPPNFRHEYGSLKNCDKELHLPSHVWLFYKGKHYDAEMPQGTNNFFKLPIFKRYVEKQGCDIYDLKPHEIPTVRAETDRRIAEVERRLFG